MTLFDFLAQASFFQWIGILAMATIVAGCAAVACFGIGNLRFRGDIVNNKINKYDSKCE